MILPFSQKINGSKNYFVYFIWQGLIREKLSTYSECNKFQSAHIKRFKENFDAPEQELLNFEIFKRHTIRRNLTKRYKAGCLLHFTINTRTKNMFRFAPIIQCVSTQCIEIVYFDSGPIVKVDNRILKCFEVRQLAKNDGFRGETEFFNYFNENFQGDIIHWTNLRY